MKNYSLAPNEKNAIELLLNSPLKRNSSVFQFVKLLDAFDDACSIALNGPWGSGKTFFVQQVKLILDAANKTNPRSEEIESAISSTYPNKFSCKGCYSTVYYDAWMHDNDDDPLLSLIYRTIESGQSQFTPTRAPKLIDAAASVADLLTGRSITGLLKTLKGQAQLPPMDDSNALRDVVQAFFNELIEEKSNRLVFFIDELDRCRPDYTISLLERIKHYCDDDRITFVFSVNIEELQAMVKCKYGSEFSATRYLDKFFDIRASIPTIDYTTLLRDKLELSESSIDERICIVTIEYFRFSIREVERYVRLFKLADGDFFNSNKIHAQPKSERIVLACIVAVTVALQIYDVSKYSAFICGKYPSPLLDIFSQPKAADIKNEIGTSSFESEVYDVYYSFFGNVHANEKYMKQTSSPKSNRAYPSSFMDIAGLLSNNLTYDFE